ncbi:hypothetical protein M407DRAFT_11998 [Tulasnella calospora MUT 4182]|uniref:Brix domain-containing protein n=1 Tax=Tulasnella calospora MUT 4182 TaxID=1051891 RepID=A0A0C3L9M2_9AGAM|nr:hypothetical protein M407DRAFT_11998 [Tulasnella calospora MUT 4182]
MERRKLEKKNPELKKKRQAENVPMTIDNTRAYDPSMVTVPSGLHPKSTILAEFSARSKSTVPIKESSTVGSSEPSGSKVTQDPNPAPPPAVPAEFMDPEHAADIANDPFAAYFDPDSERDPSEPPKVLITTSPYATAPTWAFCDELVGVFPGAQFFKRKKKSFRSNAPPLGTIAGWAVKRGYSSLIVVNEDHHKPNALTMIHLPAGPTAYFKLTSVELTREIYGHARASPHYPELVLNNFVTRLGHAVGRMFQTLFPPMPEFEGRQVVTLHNQRDFLFFRRHRYMFKSTERTALQEIGPRFTLKLRSLKTGLPSNNPLGAPMKPLEMAKEDEEPEQQYPHIVEEVAKSEDNGEAGNSGGEDEEAEEESARVEKEETKRDEKKGARKGEEFAWAWNPRMDFKKRNFYL